MNETHIKLKDSASFVEGEIYVLRRQIEESKAVPLNIIERLEKIEKQAHEVFLDIAKNVIVTPKTP